MYNTYRLTFVRFIFVRNNSEYVYLYKPFTGNSMPTLFKKPLLELTMPMPIFSWLECIRCKQILTKSDQTHFKIFQVRFTPVTP